MKTNHSFSVAQNSQQTLSGKLIQQLCRAGMVSAVLLWAVLRPGNARATDPEVPDLVTMVNEGLGQAALEQVAEVAFSRGGWEPAPGDEAVFDRLMSPQIRGASLDYDEPPEACSNPRMSPDVEECLALFSIQERQVRFGRSMFSNPTPEGQPVPRPAFDDLLATYIEEVGHSWQEYLYETHGRGRGARVHATTLLEAEYWAPGREYQIKMYILSLDDGLLNLSVQQRTMLRAHICEGYANPIGHDVPAYGAPAGWPNPDGWPVTVPAPQALEIFCEGS